MLAGNDAQARINHRVNVLIRQRGQRIGNFRQYAFQHCTRVTRSGLRFQRGKFTNEPGQHRQQLTADLQLLEYVKFGGSVINPLISNSIC